MRVEKPPIIWDEIVAIADQSQQLLPLVVNDCLSGKILGLNEFAQLRIVAMADAIVQIDGRKSNVLDDEVV